MRQLILFLTVVLIMVNLYPRKMKCVEALGITSLLVLDGVLDEESYHQVAPAKDFLQLQPYNGRPSVQPSEVRFFFDHQALYVGAILYDSSPDSIFVILLERDNVGAP